MHSCHPSISGLTFFFRKKLFYLFYHEKAEFKSLLTSCIAMFLHIPDGIFLIKNFVSYNLVLTEAPVGQLTARELQSLS